LSQAPADLAPLDDAEFAAALKALCCFEARPRIAAACSGGPDSLALAILADRWARARGGEAWALTVDHRLRPESAAEIAQVQRWLAARGIRHRVLVWDGAKPHSGIQAAARAARYRLLADWCRAHGCLHLLVGHQRQDQAETYLIRRRAGSGAEGLAGMSALRQLDGVVLLRPLLAVGRGRLAAFLDALGQPYLSDPSNRNPAFERARLRRADGAATAIADLDPILAETAAFGSRRVAAERAQAALLAGAVALHPGGFARLDPAPLLAAPPAVAEAVLAALARAVGAAPLPIRRRRVARLLAALRRPPPAARTLGGCRFVPWRAQLLVFRELAATAPPALLQPGESLLWDRRIAAALPREAAGPVTIGSLGPQGVAELNRRTPDLVHQAVPRLVRPALPAAWDGDGLLCVPALGWRRADGVAPLLSFRPLIPLTPAGFTVVCPWGHPISRKVEAGLPAFPEDLAPGSERRLS
jgi:tRNA(Ile)-lysidine synthase